MAGNDKVRKLTLLAEIDQKTIQQGVNLLAKERDAVLGVAQAEDKHASIVREYAASLGALEGKTRSSVSTARTRIETIREEIQQMERLEQQVKDLQRAEESETKTKRPGSSSISERAGSLSTGLSSIAQVLPGEGGDIARTAADIAGLVEQMPRLSEALGLVSSAETAAGLASEGAAVGAGALVTTLGPIALVAGAAAVGLVAVNAALEEGRQKTRGWIAAEEELARLRAEGTTADIEAKMREARQEEELLKARRLEIGTRLSEIADLGSGVRIPGVMNLFNVEGYADLQKAFDQVNGDLIKNAELQRGLGEALNSSGVAANDATAAEVRYQAESIAAIERRSQAEQEARRLAETATEEQVRQQIRQLEAQRAANEEAIRSISSLGGVASQEAANERIAAVQQLRTANEELAAKETALKDITLGLAAAHDRATAAAERQKETQNKLSSLTDAQAQYSESIRNLEEKLGEDRERIAKQTVDNIAAIEKRLADKQDAIREEYAKVEQDIADIISEQGIREIELRQQSEKKINKLIEDAADERTQILSDYEEEAQDAVLNRDADALARAERTRDKRLAEADKQLTEQVNNEKAALQERIDEGKKADEKRLQDLRNAYGQEASDRQNSLNQKLNELRMAADQEIALARQKEQQQISELNQHYQEQSSALNSHFAEQIKSITGHYVNVENITKEKLQAIADQIIAAYNRVIAETGSSSSGTGTGSSAGTKIPPPQPAATGLRNSPGQWSWVGEQGAELAYIPRGGSVYSHPESMRMAGGVNIQGGVNITIPIPPGAAIDTETLAKYLDREGPRIVAESFAKLAGMDV